MKSKKEVKEYLEELNEQLEYFMEGEGEDAEEAQIVEIQIETLEWVLR